MRRFHYYLHELVLPVVLFVCIGGMTWAVRGCSGFGATNGCLFAGITFATVWWFLSYYPGLNSSRKYATGWVVLAMTLGIMVSGARGWMQWPSFFEGKLLTDYSLGKYVPISRYYGFIWLFIAGVPWAGLGACFTAWCYSRKPVGVGGWVLRIGFAVLGGVVAHILFILFPSVFLPLYDSIRDKYADFATNPNLKRLVGDNWNATVHMGVYIGVLLGEVVMLNLRNVILILTVGLVNGVGWALFQNWKWAPVVWAGTNFNWWRCWESSGGISMGIAYGLAYFLVNQPGDREQWVDIYNGKLPEGVSYVSLRGDRVGGKSVLGERLALYLAVFWGLLLSLRNGLKGWANIYLGNEGYWDKVLWYIAFPILIVGTIWIIFKVRNTRDRIEVGNPFPGYVWVVWLVILHQNFIAQLITGPHNDWSEFSFAVYYILLFGISGGIIYHYQYIKRVLQNQLTRWKGL